jgi:hypothetical protein
MSEQTCTATIVVGDMTLTCALDRGGHDWIGDVDQGGELHERDGVYWTDSAPGATSHTEPKELRWHVTVWGRVGEDRDWVVTDGQDEAAIFYGSCHPDTEGAARAEAARLNETTPTERLLAIQDLRRERQALLDIIDAARPVLEHVSAGRGYVDMGGYPDTSARRALGMIHALEADHE